jgi:hypothetical protein
MKREDIQVRRPRRTGARRAARLLTAAAGVLLLAPVTAAPSRAISWADCSARDDYFRMDTHNASYCIANAGSAPIYVGDVIMTRSGNNAGWFKYTDCDGAWHTLAFGKWGQAWWYDCPITVRYVTIY